MGKRTKLSALAASALVLLLCVLAFAGLEAPGGRTLPPLTRNNLEVILPEALVGSCGEPERLAGETVWLRCGDDRQRGIVFLKPDGSVIVWTVKGRVQ